MGNKPHEIEITESAITLNCKVGDVFNNALISSTMIFLQNACVTLEDQLMKHVITLENVHAIPQIS